VASFDVAVSPVNDAPVVITPTPTQTITDEQASYDNQSAAAVEFPDLQESQPIDPDAINGVDLNNLTLAHEHPVEVTFMSEGAGYRNALGVYTIAADGTIESPQLLWTNASAEGSGGSLQPGESSVDLGTLPAGSKLGFFVVADGYSSNHALFNSLHPSGHFEFRAADGSAANIGDGAPPSLIWVAANGHETAVSGNVYHTAATGDALGLNPDGLQHAVSGVGDDAGAGALLIGFEDLFNGGDRDYQDIVFSVDIGADNANLLNPALVAPDIDVTDVDDTTVASAVAQIGDGYQAGDTLYISGYELTDVGGHTMIGNTGIELVGGGFDETTHQLALQGAGTHEVYEDILGSVSFATTSDDVGGGARTVEFTVTDPDGAVSNVGSVDMDVTLDTAIQNTIDGTNRSDHITGTDANDLIHGYGKNDHIWGGEGHDQIFGDSGNDHLYGGSGSDTLDGGTGNDLLYGDSGNDALWGGAGNDQLHGGDGNDWLAGGPGNDRLDGGAGSDLFVFAAGDGHDQVTGGEGWVDVVEIQGVEGDFNSGNWTLSLEHGQIVAQADGVATLSDDASGTITLHDGSTLDFQGIETIQW
jgi:serralysin